MLGAQSIVIVPSSKNMLASFFRSGMIPCICQDVFVMRGRM